ALVLVRKEVLTVLTSEGSDPIAEPQPSGEKEGKGASPNGVTKAGKFSRHCAHAPVGPTMHNASAAPPRATPAPLLRRLRAALSPRDSTPDITQPPYA